MPPLTQQNQQFQARAEQAEAALLRVQERLVESEARAARAEKSARDAWAFAKTILRSRRPQDGA